MKSKLDMFASAAADGHSVGAQARAEREAERCFRLARALVMCPSCHRRGRSAHAWLVAQVATIGLVVGLIGAVCGIIAALFGSLYLGVAISGSTALVGGVMGELLVAVITAALVYRHRLADVGRWTRFEPPAS